jgi:hypothetical protein
MIASVICAQTPLTRAAAAPDASSVVGVWRAEMDGLPVVTLTITNETGTLSGAVLFYLHRRDEGKPVTSTPGIPEPLFNLKFEGQILTFQVSHRRAHPPRTLSDPPVTFRLKLIGADKSGLINENETGPELTMVRTDY